MTFYDAVFGVVLLRLFLIKAMMKDVNNTAGSMRIRSIKFFEEGGVRSGSGKPGELWSVSTGTTVRAYMLR